jgi:hypothetical protein
MLRQSMVAMLLALLVVPLTVMFVLAVTIVRHGLTGFTSLRTSFAGPMRCLVTRTLACSTMIGMEMSAREQQGGAARPELTVVGRRNYTL